MHQYLYVSLPGINTHTIVCTNTCMLVDLILIHIQYYTPIPGCQSTLYYYTYNTMHKYLFVCLPGITAHTIICTNTCMLVFPVLLHIQYYKLIPVCQSTCYCYTCNTMHQQLYVSLPGITTHTMQYTNTCMLVNLVLLHIKYNTPILVCQSTLYYYTYNTINQYLCVSPTVITTHTILCTNTCMLGYLVLQHSILYTNTCMLVYLVLIHIQYYTRIPVFQSTWYYYTFNVIHQHLYASVPGITTHTILYSNTCMFVYLVLLHIQYYTPILVCQSTWYYYTHNNMHQYLYVSLPGSTTYTILCTNTCMLVYLVLLHIQYYAPIPAC